MITFIAMGITLGQKYHLHANLEIIVLLPVHIALVQPNNHYEKV